MSAHSSCTSWTLVRAAVVQLSDACVWSQRQRVPMPSCSMWLLCPLLRRRVLAENSKVHVYNPKDGSDKVLSMPEHCSSVLLSTNPDSLVITTVKCA